ncbi:MAG: hypothetical protein NT066_05865 [Candidatus Omnitrophica bacterium]|nr:hypothetical protein [Candidatus Omnitrophota bacterium]
MSLKKSLKTGQVSLEYFILFSIVAGLSFLSISTFYPRVRQAIQGSETETGFFQGAVQRIADACLKK